MPYEVYQTSANPGLLILLTDELEESVKVVNCIVDQLIIRNYDGDSPKNRCFIVVIGFNQNVKELCSGWLKDLDASPLRYEMLKEKTLDGVGGMVEVEVKRPVWVESASNQLRNIDYKNSIKLAIELAHSWLDNHVISPIVIDISRECHASSAFKEIEQLKEISTLNGNVLFFGSYSHYTDTPEYIFSNMPEQWKWRFYNWTINKNYFYNGILKREKILPVISAITYSGGLQADFKGFTI